MATIRLGDIAPDFTAESSLGKINLYDYLGDGWGILFSHPADFTPVCTTELGAAGGSLVIPDLAGATETIIISSNIEPGYSYDVHAVMTSVDGIASHHEWIKDINETQHTTVNFPIIADEDKKVSSLYDMIHPNADNNLTVRSVYIIAPDKTVKLIITYPASTGRNFHELLRVIDSLQLTAYHKVATPANWNHGEDVVVSPSIPTDEARNIFTKGVEEIKPYLRMTPDPSTV